jgi:hypothetical protein
MPNGRPSKYTPELAAEIIARMCEGESLRSICRDATMPVISTVMLWVATDREGFSEQYAKGCEARAHYWADEMLDIADDGANDYMQREGKEYVNGEAIARSRLRVDTRKWLLSKMLPKYSDKPVDAPTETLGQVIEIIRASRPD